MILDGKSQLLLHRFSLADVIEYALISKDEFPYGKSILHIGKIPLSTLAFIFFNLDESSLILFVSVDIPLNPMFTGYRYNRVYIIIIKKDIYIIAEGKFFF